MKCLSTNGSELPRRVSAQKRGLLIGAVLVVATATLPSRTICGQVPSHPPGAPLLHPVTLVAGNLTGEILRSWSQPLSLHGQTYSTGGRYLGPESSRPRHQYVIAGIVSGLAVGTVVGLIVAHNQSKPCSQCDVQRAFQPVATTVVYGLCGAVLGGLAGALWPRNP